MSLLMAKVFELERASTVLPLGDWSDAVYEVNKAMLPDSQDPSRYIPYTDDLGRCIEEAVFIANKNALESFELCWKWGSWLAEFYDGGHKIFGHRSNQATWAVLGAIGRYLNDSHTRI